MIKVTVGLNLVLAVVQQYIVPSVVNSLMSFATMDLTLATERLLKLAVPNHLLWYSKEKILIPNLCRINSRMLGRLVCFYLLFHSLLNTLGELLQFADRDFYHDWWNAANLARQVTVGWSVWTGRNPTWW